MKTLLIGIGAIVLAGLFWAGLPNEQVLAVSGCCKQRVSDNWYRIGDDFEECKELNDKTDKDNIFEQSGDYWWDVSC